MGRDRVIFEGLTAHEVLALPVSEVDELVFRKEPLVVNIGSAQIDGGGEGVLRQSAPLPVGLQNKEDLPR